MSDDTVSVRLARIENTLLHFSDSQERFEERSLITQQQLADIAATLTGIVGRFADHVDSEKRQWVVLNGIEDRTGALERQMVQLAQQLAGNLDKDELRNAHTNQVIYWLMAIMGGAATLIVQRLLNQ